MNQEPVSENFGDWQLDVVECGRLSLDGGAMFGSVPRVLWERRIAPDALHRIPLAMRLLLLRQPAESRVVLVDTGIGDKYDEKFRDMFDVQSVAGRQGAMTSLEAALAPHGVAPGDVTDLILTHMHFDHGGGVSVRDDDGLRPAFPGARHYLQRANLETAREPNLRERASYLEENVGPLGDVSLELLDGEEEILPGISVIPSHGHTRGMQVVRLEGGGRVLYYVADLSPTHHHVRVPFTMGYDLSANTIMEEKQSLWPRVVAEEAVVVFEHDPVVAAARLVEDRGRYRAEPVDLAVR